MLGEDCPVRRLLRFVGHKWSPVILYCLSTGTWRFGDLQRTIPDISKKMLVQVLRELEADGLVLRTLHPGKPPATDYRLTEAGRRLHEPVALLCRWAEQNGEFLEQIEQARPAAQ
jgi:DNA-binding HxlR family transcriptional regulator